MFNKAPLREKIYLLFKCPRCGRLKPPIKGFKLDWYDLCRKCEKELDKKEVGHDRYGI